MDALIGRELVHAADGAKYCFLFLHLVVRGAEGGDLRQVGNADDLTAVGTHLLHHLGHLFGHLAADTRVDLVEDDGGQLDGTADHGFQGEHHTGYLTAGGHLRDRLEWGGGVGAEQEGDLVLTAET